MSIQRKRLSQEDSRAVAIHAARELLIEAGPQAVTLKAVAGRIGRTHANLLHHFGSAAGLQKALIESLAESVTAEIGEAVLRARAEDSDPREVVDLTFNAFERGGGALASWMVLSGNENALNPILEAIHRLVDKLSEGHDAADAPIEEQTLALILTALGDALLGGPMATALGLPREKAREIAASQLRASIAAKRAGAQ